MWVRISADPTDRIGPSPAPGGTPDRFAERPYDHWLHLTPAERPPYPEDTFAVLRAHCGAAVARLRRHGLVESAFDIDDPAGYWTSARAVFGPALPTDVLLDVRWAAETPTTPTLPAGLTPNLHPAPADPSRTTRQWPAGRPASASVALSRVGYLTA
ncbi:hypothetical protein ACH4E7_02700 [Kitasatospora sp. NPDC018058]|uniref:hypothetical protein n=1 Tax=Kitasatospora sp. NPDC018058 TaxID=3364025 RepID=UPI0037BEC4C9